MANHCQYPKVQIELDKTKSKKILLTKGFRLLNKTNRAIKMVAMKFINPEIEKMNCIIFYRKTIHEPLAAQ